MLVARRKASETGASSLMGTMKNRVISRKDIDRLAQGLLPEPTEDDVQKVIVGGLRSRGFLVQSISRRVKKCWQCGKYPKSDGGDGVSKGVADLLVRRRTWPRGTWMALEVKRPGPIKWTNKEQKALAEDGDTIVVQSLEEAFAAVGEPPP